MSKEHEIEGIDFSSLDEVRKLMSLDNPMVNAMWETQMAIVSAYMAAEEQVIKTFCARSGIELPDLESVAMRQALMPKVELVCAMGRPPDYDGIKPVVIQESWCVDRRKGYTGHEHTWPRAQVVEHAGTLSVRIVDKEEKEDGTD